MESNFLQHIIDNPFDLHRRLVFSDWLEEQGRTDDAQDQRWMSDQEQIDCTCENVRKLFSNKEDQEKYTKLSVIGNPAYAAYCMTHYCNSDRLWAENVIESAKVGNPALAAYYMTHYCNSDRLWAETIIQTAKMGNPALAAYLMTYNCKGKG
jgi:uncharacterized protein (TIGR02996 family)